VVSFLENKNTKPRKKVVYTITTNGSLLTDEIIQFFNRHRFLVTLSFDGLAQEITRGKAGYKDIFKAIESMLRSPAISLEINSVFTPVTVEYLSKSIKFILDIGVTNINFTLSATDFWDQASLVKLKAEMSKLREIALSIKRKCGSIPVKIFSDEKDKGIFCCAAGRDRLAITADGQVWGCFLFADYFREKRKTSEFNKYYFGTLDDFIAGGQAAYSKILLNYSRLSMDNFKTKETDCFLCPELKFCQVCPISAAFSGLPIGRIPEHLCTIQRIKHEEIRRLRRNILGGPSPVKRRSLVVAKVPIDDGQ
jgi:sulfatase maturation enzyme AslB (radical SAM superfamily)